MSTIKQFKDPQGNLCAYAAIPDNYLIGSSIVDKLQHESVPFFITCHAIDSARNIMIFGLTDEMFTTYTNKFIKMTLKAVPNVIWTSIRDWIEPDEYLQQFAEAMSQMQLTATAQSSLPSLIGNNIQKYYDSMMKTYQQSFDIEGQLGTPTYPNNSLCRSFLRRYEGVAASGVPTVVLAGMDYKGVEYYTSVSALLKRRQLLIERLRGVWAVGILRELRSLQRRRQVVAVDAIVRGGQHRPLDAILQLAHVARP